MADILGTILSIIQIIGSLFLGYTSLKITSRIQTAGVDPYALSLIISIIFAIYLIIGIIFLIKSLKK